MFAEKRNGIIDTLHKNVKKNFATAKYFSCKFIEVRVSITSYPKVNDASQSDIIKKSKIWDSEKWSGKMKSLVKSDLQ